MRHIRSYWVSPFQTICFRRPRPTAGRLGGKAVPDRVSQSTAYTEKKLLCVLLPQMGHVVFWVRGSVARDRTPPSGTQWTVWNREVSRLACTLSIASFQSGACRVLSSTLPIANSLGLFLIGCQHARHMQCFRSASIFWTSPIGFWRVQMKQQVGWTHKHGKKNIKHRSIS